MAYLTICHDCSIVSLKDILHNGLNCSFEDMLLICILTQNLHTTAHFQQRPAPPTDSFLNIILQVWAWISEEHNHVICNVKRAVHHQASSLNSQKIERGLPDQIGSLSVQPARSCTNEGHCKILYLMLSLSLGSSSEIFYMHHATINYTYKFWCLQLSWHCLSICN